MLKRQRPASPSPTFSSVPLVITDPPADLVGRDTKRRRMLPPVLDGAYRGWGQATPLPINIAEDDEDYISDDEIENNTPKFSINCSLTQQQAAGDKAEYASANSFLRELHTLQQHRLLFSSLPPPLSASSFLSYGSNSKDAAYSSNILSYSGYHPPLIKGHFNLPPHLPTERPRVSSNMSQTSISKLPQQPNHGLPIDEIHSVTEHYEGTNKFLGSLFLSRRRVLDGSDQRPGS